MERMFDISIEVGGHRKEREKAIIAACKVEWGFRDDDFGHVRANGRGKWLLQASALCTISDGEMIEDIVARIEHAVWRENGGMCHVQCDAEFMGELDAGPALVPYDEAEDKVA